MRFNQRSLSRYYFPVLATIVIFFLIANIQSTITILINYVCQICTHTDGAPGHWGEYAKLKSVCMKIMAVVNLGRVKERERPGLRSVIVG